MKLSHLALVVALSAVTAFAVSKYTAVPTPSAAKLETAFERVMRTGTLRCGYLVMPPQLSRDPNTGAMSGISYDIVNMAASRLNLKVDWAEEVGFLTFMEGLKNGRYDAICFTGYRWVPWSTKLEYARPLFLTTTNVYVRAEDHRFDGDLNLINDPAVKVVVSDDGEASTFIRAEVFPKSTAYSLPVNVDHSMMLESVATKKADVALFNPMEAMPYLLANAGKIRRVEGHKPVRHYLHAMSFNKGEQDLTSSFNAAFDEMLTDGTIDKILDKYEAIPDSFVRIKSPITYHEKTETK